MSKTIYIAGRFSRREEFQRYAAVLETKGWTVTSTWLKQPHAIDMQTPGVYHDGQRQEFALKDYFDVVEADYLLYFTEDFQQSRNFLARRGGRHVELGIALGVGNHIYLVGPKENIFCYLPSIEQFDDFQAFFSTRA